MFDPLPGTELPEWGRWEKCPALGPRNVDCRVIVPPQEYLVSGIGASMDVNVISGRTNLALSYWTADQKGRPRGIFYVFDPDGPTLNAMIADVPWQGGCQLDLHGMHQGKLVIGVGGKDPWGELNYAQQAVLGGDADGPLAKLAYQWDPPPQGDWLLSAFPSSDLLVTVSQSWGRAVADWKTMDMKEIWRF